MNSVHGDHFIEAVAQHRQIQFQVLVVSSDDVLHQLIERCRLQSLPATMVTLAS